MRKLKVLSIICLALLAMVGCRKKEINKLKDEVNDLKTRVTVLEETCKQNNTNIVSLQTVINASTEGDYITSITPITKDGVEIGYTIAFKNQKPITIYNGTNGTSPTIGVTNVDGNYYWTLNGEFLLDENDNKIRVTGENGAKPSLKIEDGNWYVSYDDGSSWNFVSNVKEGLGETGAVFNEVTYDENFVYFTLADGTQLKIARQDAVAVSSTEGAILFEFSVSETKKVYFSQGNLQYQASTNTWRFAENQWDYVGTQTYTQFHVDMGHPIHLGGTVVGSDNALVSPTYEGWIDLFGCGTSGWDRGFEEAYQPYSISDDASKFYIGGKVAHGLLGDFANADWGIYNNISNGGNVAGLWRTLTYDEWYYLLFTRSNAIYKLGEATVNKVKGLVLLPDDWTISNSITFSSGYQNGFSTNTYSIDEWRIMESNGAIFLPTAGTRDVACGNVHDVDSCGEYWSSSPYSYQAEYRLFFNENKVSIDGLMNNDGQSVRLVKDVE